MPRLFVAFVLSAALFACDALVSDEPATRVAAVQKGSAEPDMLYSQKIIEYEYDSNFDLPQLEAAADFADREEELGIGVCECALTYCEDELYIANKRVEVDTEGDASCEVRLAACAAELSGSR